MKSLTPAAFLAAILLATGAASASVTGLPNAGIGSATWDLFPSTTFTAASPTTASGNFSSTLNFTASANALLLGGGERIYAGGDGTSLQIDGTVNTVPLDGLTLIMKFTAPAFGAAADFYTMNFNGNAGTETFVGTSTEGANTFQIYQWNWSGLTLTPGSTFQITGTGAADHVSLDAIQLGSVPEASTSLLGALAAGAMLVRRRR